jgi:hypothetical protein
MLYLGAAIGVVGSLGAWGAARALAEFCARRVQRRGSQTPSDPPERTRAAIGAEAAGT